MSKKIISKVLLEVADAIETGNFGKKVKVGLTTLGRYSFNRSRSRRF